MKKVLLASLLFLGSSVVYGGNLIKNAEITQVASSNDGKSNNFYLEFASGTGVCSAGNWVIFPIEMAPSEDALNRMYSTALLAFSTGKKVRVYSHDSDDCSKASFIEVTN